MIKGKGEALIGSRFALRLKQDAANHRRRKCQTAIDCRARTLDQAMTDPSPVLSRDPLTRRALELDALAAILTMDRRDRLAEILTDEDVATLKHLAKEGMGENSLRALASDLAYLEAWVLASTGTPLPWPAPEVLALKFVAHHLWDPVRRDTDPGHGMPADIAGSLHAGGVLRADGAHAPATVRRRLSSWATLHHWKGVAGPFKSPALRSAIR